MANSTDTTSITAAGTQADFWSLDAAYSMAKAKADALARHHSELDQAALDVRRERGSADEIRAADAAAVAVEDRWHEALDASRDLARALLTASFDGGSQHKRRQAVLLEIADDDGDWVLRHLMGIDPNGGGE